MTTQVRPRKSDLLFAAALVLNATGLFRFLAVPFIPLGGRVAHVSGVLLMLCAGYVCLNLPRLLGRWPRLLPWLFVLLLWPLGTLLYAPVLDWREIGLQVYFVLLVLSTISFSNRGGRTWLGRVFLTSFVLSLLGLVLNLVHPQLFADVTEITNADVLPAGRPGGFCLQPNALAIGMVFIFLGWLLCSRGESFVLEPAMIVLLLAAELATGSRMGLVFALFVDRKSTRLNSSHYS